MRRSAGGWAVIVLVVLVGGAAWADRLGPAERPPAEAAGDARSATWICPHGGGPGWTGTIVVVAPGPQAVHARIRSLGAGGADGGTRPVTIPAGTQVALEASADQRGSASVVDVFGGWAAVGWQVRAGEDERGLGVEPCSPRAGGTWYAAGLPTRQGEHAFVVATNPFAAVAIVDVAISSPDAPPVRDPELTDLAIPPGASIAIPVHDVVPGKAATAVTVTASTGRIAVASLAVDEAGGVRSILGTQETATAWFLPAGGGTNQASLAVGVPGEDAVRLRALLRTADEDARPAGGLVDARQAAVSAGGYPVPVDPPVSVDVTATGPVVVSLGVEGLGTDDAATGGVTAPARDWLVIPTVQEVPRTPGIVLVNPGADPVQAEVSPIAGDPAAAGATTIEIAPGRAIEVPAAVFDEHPAASVLVRANGPIVALGASTSAGAKGIAAFALAVGVPVPAWALEG